MLYLPQKKIADEIRRADPVVLNVDCLAQHLAVACGRRNALEDSFVVLNKESALLRRS